ncbi:MAG: hypothetical protein JOS17DRAFT_744575 [Linnemannia elongata]|nr:MAG: hypothetical protein JOS17DRAFT_744575 [Linnemannia elongata]
MVSYALSYDQNRMKRFISFHLRVRACWFFLATSAVVVVLHTQEFGRVIALGLNCCLERILPPPTSNQDQTPCPPMCLITPYFSLFFSYPPTPLCFNPFSRRTVRVTRRGRFRSLPPLSFLFCSRSQI